MRIVPVILAGGAGERLWPLSSHSCPKQYLALQEDGLSLFEETLLRVMDRSTFAAPLVICALEHHAISEEQLHGVGISDAKLLLEPIGRNTAPAIACAALSVAPESLLLVLPADHVITKLDAWLAAVRAAVPVVRDDRLLTFGITPDAPETGYGYMQCGALLPAQTQARAIERFVEKPDKDTAATYLATGSYVWNSGMFFGKAGVLLAEMARHAPKVLEAATQACANAKAHGAATLLDHAALMECPSVSIDYAVMEHTVLGAVMSVDIGWSDMGSWNALDAIAEKDEHGNATQGAVMAQDTKNCYLLSDGPMIATIGVQNLVVVAANNAVLVGSKERMQEIKKLIPAQEAKSASFSKRHWGAFYKMDSGEGYQVKRLIIEPGKKISLQTHAHRSEHWVVVKGTATVINASEVLTLTANQSTYIPAGAKHCLENKGTEDLIVIEVQTGTYLGEDDIVRYETSEAQL